VVAAQDGSDGRNLTGRKMRSIKSSLVVGAGGARPMRGRLYIQLAGRQEAMARQR
jgi:hypothetical protein